MSAEVALTAEDNVDDFESFFRAEYDGLFRTLALSTGNRQEADDLAQDAMVRLFERWDRLSHVESKRAYLFTVAFNLLRRRRKRDALLRKIVRAGAVDLGIQGPDNTHELLDSIANLPRAHREALILVEWLGFSSVEAAAVLHVKPGTVRGRIHAARARLKIDLGIEVSDDEPTQ